MTASMKSRPGTGTREDFHAHRPGGFLHDPPRLPALSIPSDKQVARRRLSAERAALKAAGVPVQPSFDPGRSALSRQNPGMGGAVCVYPHCIHAFWAADPAWPGLRAIASK